MSNKKHKHFKLMNMALILAVILLLGNGLPQIAYTDELFEKADGTGTACIQGEPCSLQTALNLSNESDTVYVATGLTTDCHHFVESPDGCGCGLFVCQASPHIFNNVINDNMAAVTSAGQPVGTVGYGDGAYINLSSRVEIINNTIVGNAGSQDKDGAGGELFTYNCSAGVRIEDNRFNDNYGTTSDSNGWGGGISLGSSSALMQNNIIQDNVASSRGSSTGSGLYQWNGAPTIRGNLVSGNQSGEAVYLGYSGALFEENYVVGNNTTTGVKLIYQTGPSGPTLQNNIITGNGTYTVHIDGSDSYPLSVTLNHNTLVGEGASYGIYINDYSTVLMDNNIVSGHTDTEIYVFDPGTSSDSADHILFRENNDDGERGTNPVDGDPAFLNPAGLDYHIGAKSSAINTDVDIGATTDIDNDTRPLIDGYDIVGDEYNTWSTFGDELIVDFGPNGLWHYDGSSWSSLAGWNSSGMEEWTGGLAVDFGTYGLWNYDGSSWTSLAGWNPSNIKAYGTGLAVDFDTYGLWYYNSSTWTSLAGWDPEGMEKWGNELAVDFGMYGLWNYDGSSWASLAGWDPSNIKAYGTGLAVDFDTYGVWYYDGSAWTSLVGWNAEDMEAWASSLAVDFGTSYGLWNYDGSAWYLLTTWDAEDMISDGGSQEFPVWTVDGMQRVKPDAPAEIGPSIELFAARGEYEPFQIIIRAPEGGLNNVNVLAQDLTGPGNQKISKSNITLYREHYIYLDRGSNDWGGTNQPLGPGWYPEPLIPFVDPQTGDDLVGAELDAVPFNLAEGENQPIWVDVFVPRNAQAGKYIGTFTVISQQGNVDIYLTLNVWDFELPLAPSFTAVTQLWNADRRKESFSELLKHRFNPYSVGPDLERELIDEYGLKAQNTGFWSGADYGNCDPLPAPPPLNVVLDEVAEHHGDLMLFAHYADEIQDCPNIFDDAVEWAKRLREGGVKPLLPTGVVSGLIGDSHENSAADIWVTLPIYYDYYIDNIIQVLKRGEKVWSYNALVQDGYSPKWTIDFTPINFRIQPGFISQRLNLTGLQYWLFDHWTDDPWNDLTKRGDEFPGDGQFVYPGAQVGIKGVVAGMRLKWLREGIEDYEYVEILKSLGREEFALDIAKQVGPDWQNWTRSTDELYSARKTIGEEIHQISTSPPYPNMPPAAPENLRTGH